MFFIFIDFFVILFINYIRGILRVFIMLQIYYFDFNFGIIYFEVIYWMYMYLEFLYFFGELRYLFLRNDFFIFGMLIVLKFILLDIFF